MLSVVSIVGKSGAGKTPLIEGLVKEFKKRGYRIATVEHLPRRIDIDKPGKDSWRFAEAGSSAVITSSPGKLAFVKNTGHDPNMEEILHVIGSELDLVLAEGFGKAKAPRIEVHRKELGGDLLYSAEELCAVATDEPLDTDVPQLPLANTEAIADFIEKSFVFPDKGDTWLFVNGKQVFINAMVKDIIAKTLLAMVSTLKGVEEIRSLDISIRNKPGSTVTLSDGEATRRLSQASRKDSSLWS